MFFADSSAWKVDFERVGYDPDTDQPETAKMPVQMADELGFAVRTCAVHPLAGITPQTSPLPPLKLGISDRTDDGWYRLSQIKLE
jgi:hypothetical protein